MARWFVDRLPHKGIPSVSLRRLLPEARFEGCQDLEVSGCTADSRRLDPGQVFVAVRGRVHDGHAFVAQALERGAAGVVVERHCPEAGRLQVIVPDTRAAHARLAHALAGEPSKHLTMIGVTGTTGKTATTLFVRSIFEASGYRFGSLGSLGWSDGLRSRPAGAANVEAEGIAGILHDMVERGCKGAVLEIARRALDRGTVEGIAFDTAVVTDVGGPPALEPDQLIARRRSQARLCRMLNPGGTAVVNADDPHAEILGAVNLEARRVSFGIDQPADITGVIERLESDGSRFTLRGFDREAKVSLRLVGPGSVSQALAAAGAAWAHGISVHDVVAGLEAVSSIPGRLEPVVAGQDFDVRVDQAQVGAALQEALTALRTIASGRIHCVIGAEGHQNRTVRLSLARAAEAGADRVVLTTDNPRGEDPNQILDDLLAGLRRPGRARVEIDRRRAIELALADAGPGDVVLIAGKGRNNYQIFADRAVPFDDRAVAADWLNTHRANRQRSSA